MLTIKEQAWALATEVTDYLSIATEPYEVNAIQHMAERRIEQAINERALHMRDALAWIEGTTDSVDSARLRKVATQGLMGEKLDA